MGESFCLRSDFYRLYGMGTGDHSRGLLPLQLHSMMKSKSLVLDQSWRRGKRTSTYGAAAKLVMRILTCLFIYLTRTQEAE
jgi:hypothetical protein